jgi:sulfide:quinone oxidoreductase
MDATTTLILGGGFGGIAAARTLRSLLPAEHRIVLVDKAPAFAVGATKTWVMTGDRAVAEVSRPRDILVPAGVEVLETNITAIDPLSGEVGTAEGTLRGHYLVVALGADVSWDPVPGLEEATQTFYTMEGAVRLRDTLQEFTGGEVVFLISRKPFKCPPAPYEAAMLLHEVLEERGLRAGTRLSIHTFEGAPMSTAGPEMGAFIRDELERREIAFHPQHTVSRADAQSHTIFFEEGGHAHYDLLIAVPPHVPPRVVAESRLAGQGGWILVNPRTLEVESGVSGVPVYAVGDVTTVPLPGRYRPEMPLVLPKAGIIAAAQGRVVGTRIAAEILGKPLAEEYDGTGACFVETGKRQAVQAAGAFYELPHPRMEARSPSEQQHREKLAWVTEWMTPVL